MQGWGNVLVRSSRRVDFAIGRVNFDNTLVRRTSKKFWHRLYDLHLNYITTICVSFLAIYVGLTFVTVSSKYDPEMIGFRLLHHSWKSQTFVFNAHACVQNWNMEKSEVSWYRNEESRGISNNKMSQRNLLQFFSTSDAKKSPHEDNGAKNKTPTKLESKLKYRPFKICLFYNTFIQNYFVIMILCRLSCKTVCYSCYSESVI